MLSQSPPASSSVTSVRSLVTLSDPAPTCEEFIQHGACTALSHHSQLRLAGRLLLPSNTAAAAVPPSQSRPSNCHSDTLDYTETLYRHLITHIMRPGGGEGELSVIKVTISQTRPVSDKVLSEKYPPFVTLPCISGCVPIVV